MIKIIYLISILIVLCTQVEGKFDFSDIYYTAKNWLGLNGNNVDIQQEKELKASVTDVHVVDHSHEGLPKVRLGGRVVDLFSGWHFDDILQDSPDEIRPASLVVFYNSSDPICMDQYNALNYDSIAERKLPARSQLFTARYDMYSAPKRAWFEFMPEMDLEKRFGVKNCPEVVFTSRECDGFTEWCKQGKDPEDPALEILGCKDYVEHCYENRRRVFPLASTRGGIANQGDELVKWVTEQIERDGRPKLSKFLGTYADQGSWMQKREYTTCYEHFRITYLAQAFPAFTKRGFKAMDTPKELQDWLLEFVKTHEKFRKTEHWNAESTQMSFHEKPTTFIDMDRVRAKKEEMARKYLQPILEEWSNLDALELTSFYGIREYHEKAWLRQHVDRIDTHVISITISVAKRNFDFDVNGTYPYKPWPLVVTDWTGKQISYDHPPGTMLLYESSKLPHGRTFRNEGGVHLGCFVHFKPVNMHGADAQKWDDITAKARKNQAIHTEHKGFVATAEIELENPVYAELNVGEKSVWKNNAEESSNSGQFGVEFRNRSDRTLEVYWYHPEYPNPVAQGRIWPGASFSVNTYHGHTFFWSEPDKATAIPGGKFTIDVGKKVYEYKFDKKGDVVREG